MKKNLSIHGPKGKKITDIYRAYLKCPVAFLHQNEKDYPGVSTFKMLIHRIYHITNPTFIQHILQKNHRNYEKGFDQNQMKQIFGNSLITSEGSHWLKMRKRIQPFFLKRQVDTYIPKMIQIIESSLQGQVLKKTPDSLYSFLSQIALKIVSTSLFDYEVDNKFADAIGEQQDLLYKRMTGIPIPLWIPTPSNKRFLRHQKEFHKLAEHIIEQAEEKDNELIKVIQESGISSKEIKDEVLTLLLAGHETTASALYFTLYLLEQNLDKKALVQEEIHRVLETTSFAKHHISQLSYTRKVIMEALRLFPPVWGTSRQAIKDEEFEGYKIKKKTIINISPYAMHRSERYWDQPKHFEPSRFDNRPDKYVYFPFGGGQRKCIGEYFAMTEMVIFLAICLSKFQIDFTAPVPLDLQVAITLRPQKSLKFVVNEKIKSFKC